MYPFAENAPSEDETVARTCNPAIVTRSDLFLPVPFMVTTKLLLVNTPLALVAFRPFLIVYVVPPDGLNSHPAGGTSVIVQVHAPVASIP
jgi:hypothetical protein